jgi:Kef-type K+ transport system membrane component KefB
MSLGMLCVLLFRSGFVGLGEAHQGRSFILFMGAATSITAMPVLAAIVRERGLATTVVGATATAAAGTMDLAAWLLLAAALIGSGHAGRFSLPVTLSAVTGSSCWRWSSSWRSGARSARPTRSPGCAASSPVIPPPSPRW